MELIYNNLANIVTIILVLAILYLCLRNIFNKKNACCVGCTKQCSCCMMAHNCEK